MNKRRYIYVSADTNRVKRRWNLDIENAFAYLYPNFINIKPFLISKEKECTSFYLVETAMLII